MSNRFKLWFSRNGGKAIVTIILIIAFCKLMDRADNYYANKNSEKSNSSVNSSNNTNVVNETNTVNDID